MNWQPGQLVETAAYRSLKDAALEVASRNRVIGMLGARGGGLSFMAKNLQDQARSLGISGKVAYVEFWGEEETAGALRRIALAVGGDPNKIPFVAGVSQLFDRIVESVISHQIHLLIIDNTQLLTPETLNLIGHLTSKTPRIQGLANLPAQLTLYYDPKDRVPSESFLGAVLLGTAFDKDQTQALVDSCDWLGIEPLPLLGFPEMAALMVGFDSRFAPVAETAQLNNKSEEFLLLQATYRESRGVFARFERILRRFDLSGTKPLNVRPLMEAIDDYVRCQITPNLSAPKSSHL